MQDKPKQTNPPASVPVAAETPRTFLSHDLMGGERLVIIRHEKEDYRLQITAGGKLILTK